MSDLAEKKAEVLSSIHDKLSDVLLAADSVGKNAHPTIHAELVVSTLEWVEGNLNNLLTEIKDTAPIMEGMITLLNPFMEVPGGEQEAAGPEPATDEPDKCEACPQNHDCSIKPILLAFPRNPKVN